MGMPRAAEGWPPWTDEDRWVPTEAGLGPEDAEWWTPLGEDHHDEVGPAPDDPIWDQRAEESAAADQLEAGIRMF